MRPRVVQITEASVLPSPSCAVASPRSQDVGLCTPGLALPSSGHCNPGMAMPSGSASPPPTPMPNK
jgi:hypothetical protein